MEITGKIIVVLPPQSGVSQAGNNWKKQEYVLETEETYPKKVHFDFFGERADQYNWIKIGDRIRLSFDIESREYNNRWYTSIRGWKAEKPTMPPRLKPWPRQALQHNSLRHRCQTSHNLTATAAATTSLSKRSASTTQQRRMELSSIRRCFVAHRESNDNNTPHSHDAQRGMQTPMPASPAYFSGKTAALLLHIRQHRVAPHKISGAKQMQTVIGEPLAHAASGRVYHL